MEHVRSTLDGGSLRYRLRENGKPLRYREVIQRWQSSHAFRRDFTALLSAAEFGAIRWETPAISETLVDREFEFVLLDAPRFVTRRSDRRAFAEHFTDDEERQGVVAFANLRGDSTMVAPSPRTGDAAYGHLAAFLREAPAEQTDAFWQVVGETVASRLGAKPIWVSTAGGGVAWLHLRLDPSPKYYGHAAYRDIDYRAEDH